MTGTKNHSFRTKIVFIGIVLSGGLSSVSYAKSLPEHKFDLGARIRYADLSSEASNTRNNGKAASLLLRFSLASDWFKNTREFQVSSYIEIDRVDTAFKDDHSDAVRFNGQPIFPDVPGTEFNQAWIKTSLNDVELTLGRQSIQYDNQRFIGSNSFWQNNQTFDAAHLQLQWLSASKASYAYIANVNRILGDDASDDLQPSDTIYNFYSGERPTGIWGDHKQKTHLFRLEINEWDYSQWVSYAYLIDNRDEPSRSADTVGSRYDFRYQPSDLKYRLEAELALQNSHNANNMSERTHYGKLLVGVGYRSLEISARIERFSAKSGISFSTALGSLHEFQGWADRFSRAPAEGLIDSSLKVKWRYSPWKIDIRYHQFQATEVSQRYGREFDLDIIFKTGKNQSIQFRFADFHAHSESTGQFRDEKRAIMTYSYNI